MSSDIYQSLWSRDQLTCEGVRLVSVTTIVKFRRCALAGLLTYGKISRVLEFSIDNVFGTVVHKFSERSIKGEFRGMSERDVAREFDRAIMMKENCLIDDWRFSGLLPLAAAKNSEVKKKKAIKQAIRLSGTALAQPEPALETEQKPEMLGFQMLRHPVKQAPRAEVTVENDELGLIGKIDVLLTEHEIPIVEDLKTGTVLDEAGNVSIDIQEQMAIYAGLYHRSQKMMPKVRVREIGGKIHNLDFGDEQIKKILSIASDEARRIQSLCLGSDQTGPPLDDLANPVDPATDCRFCGYRPGCSQYLKHYFYDIPTEARYDGIGRVIAIDPIRSNRSRLKLESMVGDEVDSVEISGQEAKRTEEVGNFQIGQVIGVFNVKKPFRKTGFEAQKNSAVFQYSPEFFPTK
ncbi:PD-(D/E)XK nuclease family protein [Arenicellales bacterium nBUS_48]